MHKQNKEVELWFTLGPNSREPEIIKELIAAGATGARLTLSYSTPEWHIEKAKLLKETAKQLGKKCFVVADLEGEKFRIGNFESPQHFKVVDGDKLTLVASTDTWKEVKDTIPIKSYNFFKFVSQGDKIVIGDASAILVAESKNNESLKVRAIGNGVINPNRGIVAQNSHFQPGSFTQKDKADLLILLKEAFLFDAIALSFTSSSEPIKEVKSLMKENGVDIPIIAKIETQKGIENINSIAEYSDFLMAARGDLAIFTPWEELFGHVKCISEAASNYKKKWILATQIAEGLERFAFPTRAEICDLSHWLSLGVDGVMVSYETAFGPKPKEVIQCIRNLINRWS